MHGRALQWLLCAGLCACGRIGFSGTAAGDGGAGDAGGDPDAMAGDPSALACNVAFELMEIPEPWYWFAAGPYGVLVTTKADNADTMVVTRFAQQGAVLNEAEQIELDSDPDLPQPVVTPVEGGWLVGATDDVAATHFDALTGGLAQRGGRDAPYGTWILQPRGDHAMAAVEMGPNLGVMEISALAQDEGAFRLITNNAWEEPSVGETGVGLVVTYRSPGATQPCTAVQLADGTSSRVDHEVGFDCTNIAVARNAVQGETMAITTHETAVVDWAIVPEDSTPATAMSFAFGEIPMIVSTGSGFTVGWVDAQSSMHVQTMAANGAVSAAVQVGANYDDGRLDLMAPDVPVALWLDHNVLFAERLCL